MQTYYQNDPFAKSMPLLATLFFITTISLEVNFGPLGFNVGNLLALGSSLVILLLALQHSPAGYLKKIFYMPDFFWAFVLGIFYFCTVYWSVSPKDSLIQSVYYIGILFGCYSLYGCDRNLIIRTLLLTAFWVAMLSLLALVVSRNYALQPVQSTSFPELRGIFKHQQRLGLFMCMSLGIGVIAYINKEKNVFVGPILKYRKSLFLFLGFIAIFAFARLFILFSVISFVVAFLLTKYRVIKYLIITFFICYGIYLYNINIGTQLMSSYESGDLSLTGRLLVWERTLNNAFINPLLGYGYGVFYSPTLDYMWGGGYRPPHAHNSFIQAFFDGGWFGLTLIIMLIVAHFKAIIKSQTKLEYSAFIFLQTLLAGLTGVTYAGKPSIILTCLFLFIAVNPNRTYIKFK